MPCPFALARNADRNIWFLALRAGSRLQIGFTVGTTPKSLCKAVKIHVSFGQIWSSELPAGLECQDENELILAERLARWQRLKSLVLDSVSSPITRRMYNMALDEFIAWFQREPRPSFTKATVTAWHAQ